MSVPLTEGLERRVKILSRLVETSVTLNSTLELDALLTSIIHTAAEVLESERASILLWDERKNELHFAASTGSDNEVLAKIPVPLNGSIAGTIFRENKPVIANDIARDPRHYRKVGQQTGLETRSLIGVPMRVKNRVTGVLEAVNKIGGDFGQEDVEILSILADQAAVALNNARILDELQKAYKELGEVDRMKSAFIAIASHELRTPLLVILGYADILRQTGEGQAGEFGKRVLASAVQMRNIVEDLTNLKYLEIGHTPGNRELTDLRQIIAVAHKEMVPIATAKSQKLIVEETKLPMPVRVDRKRMVVALTKLISNAIAFTPDGGEIRVRGTARGDEAWVQVEDTGPGIPTGQEEAIFERFYQLEDHMTRKHAGLGLGLSIVRGTAEVHGGRVWAENRDPGPGTCFTMVIPMAARNPGT